MYTDFWYLYKVLKTLNKIFNHKTKLKLKKLKYYKLL